VNEGEGRVTLVDKRCCLGEKKRERMDRHVKATIKGTGPEIQKSGDWGEWGTRKKKEKGGK